MCVSLRAKIIVHESIKKFGFFAILVAASIPNPVWHWTCPAWRSCITNVLLGGGGGGGRACVLVIMPGNAGEGCCCCRNSHGGVVIPMGVGTGDVVILNDGGHARCFNGTRRCQLFDLAGLTCGHFLIPFWTFFGATCIGKAIVKVS